MYNRVMNILIHFHKLPKMQKPVGFFFIRHGRLMQKCYVKHAFCVQKKKCRLKSRNVG